MKKLMLIAFVLMMAFIFAVPAMATDVKFKGSYRIDGRYYDNVNKDSDNERTRAHIRHRFELRTEFIVTDAIKITTKFDALDYESFGTRLPDDAPEDGVDGGTAIDFDRAYMTVKVPFGSFRGGRMLGGVWGLKFGDDAQDYDRLRFDTKFGNFSTGLIYQKNVELDYDTKNVADQDKDVYYWYGVYKSKPITGGLLYGYAKNQTNPVVDILAHAFLPYFKANFGKMFSLQGEAIIEKGTIDPDAVGVADTDINTLCYNLEGKVKFGPTSIMGGYAYASGQAENDADMTMGNLGNAGIADDFGPLLVLTYADDILNSHYANNGTHKVALAGVKLIYGDVTWKISKKFKLAFKAGMASAAEQRSNLDDKYGTEVDVRADWKVMKGLTWIFWAGYLDAGDWFKGTNEDFSVDNTFTIFNRFLVKF